MRKSNHNPLYIDLAGIIWERIASGEYPPGSRIPTETELEHSFEVSRITVRKAMELLVEEGAIVRRRKLGTFVSEKKKVRYLDKCMSFTQMCERNGGVAGARFLSVEMMAAWPALARDLRLDPAEERVLCIRRLRTFNGVPVCIEENYYSRSFSFLLSEDLEGSLYEVLERQGIQIGGSEKTIGICYASKEDARLLAVEEKEALIRMQDLVYDKEGQPVFYGRELVNAGRFEYRVHQEA